MKLVNREKIIDGLVERVINSIKEEVRYIKDVTIAIKHPDVSKRCKIGKSVQEPIFLIKEKDMAAFTMFWDDFELFKSSDTALDFYIKSKMMQYTSFYWFPIWFDALPSIITDYNPDKVKKEIKEYNNET